MKHQEDIRSPLSNIASFYTKSLEFDLTQQTFNTKIVLRLGALGMRQYCENTEINTIHSPAFDDANQYLFQIQFIQVNKNSPEFHSTYKSCESALIFDFAKLGIALHQEGLLSLITFATNLQEEIEENWGNRSVDRVGSAALPDLKKQLSTISEEIVSQLNQGLLIYFVTTWASRSCR